LETGQVDEAIVHLRKAVEAGPDAAVPCNNLASALLLSGQVDDAITLLRRALKSRPDYVNAHYNLGEALSRKGLLDEAIAEYRKAVQIQPDFPGVHHGLGIALYRQAKAADALAEFQKALELQPQSAEANSTLAWFLATCPDASFRDGARAVEYAQRAEQITGGRDPAILATLATAYAADGRTAEAIETAGKGMDLAKAQGNTTLVEKLRQQIGRYEAGTPPSNAVPEPRQP
jgi:tetratricopeptide (TPR) repeat protein